MASASLAKTSNSGEKLVKTNAPRDAKTINAIKQMAFAKATVRTDFLERSVTRHVPVGAKVVDAAKRTVSATMVANLAGVVTCAMRLAQKELVQKGVTALLANQNRVLLVAFRSLKK